MMVRGRRASSSGVLTDNDIRSPARTRREVQSGSSSKKIRGDLQKEMLLNALDIGRKDSPRGSVIEEEDTKPPSPSSSYTSAKENSVPTSSTKKRASTNRNLMMTYSPKKRRPSSAGGKSTSRSAQPSTESDVDDATKSVRRGRGRPPNSWRSTSVISDSRPSMSDVISSDKEDKPATLSRASRRSIKVKIVKDNGTIKVIREDGDIEEEELKDAAEDNTKKIEEEDIMETEEADVDVENEGDDDEEKGDKRPAEKEPKKSKFRKEKSKPEEKPRKEDESDKESDDSDSGSGSGSESDDDSGSSSDDDSEKEIYVVERIDDKRFVKGVPFYFIKWKGWPDSSNTWEPRRNLDGCPELLERFEKNYVEKKNRRHTTGGGGGTPAGGRNRRKDSVEVEEVLDDSRTQMKSYDIIEEWKANIEPISVEGVINVDGVLTYVVKRKVRLGSEKLDRNNAVLVYAKTFRKWYPELIIKFYESRVVWNWYGEISPDQEYVASKMALLRMNQNHESALEGGDNDKTLIEVEEDKDNTEEEEGVGVDPVESETQIVDLSQEKKDELAEHMEEDTQVIGYELVQVDEDDHHEPPEDTETETTDISSGSDSEPEFEQVKKRRDDDSNDEDD